MLLLANIFSLLMKKSRQLGYKALKMNNDNVVKKVAFQKEKVSPSKFKSK